MEEETDEEEDEDWVWDAVREGMEGEPKGNVEESI